MTAAKAKTEATSNPTLAIGERLKRIQRTLLVVRQAFDADSDDGPDIDRQTAEALYSLMSDAEIEVHALLQMDEATLNTVCEEP